MEKKLEDTLAPPIPITWPVISQHVNDINLRLGTLCLSHKPSGDLMTRGRNGRLAAHRALRGAPRLPVSPALSPHGSIVKLFSP
ncbi:hypothetical protein E2C01_019692 [Portunus trituberculatus]|uniref:Uncharacterized protein n=1 Tax=Portunus trituberculatus TaxID=210409 RepID=A0A5B7DYB4_PORTR|nr:hypothetical protein [Portunus trituberculatus]